MKELIIDLKEAIEAAVGRRNYKYAIESVQLALSLFGFRSASLGAPNNFMVRAQVIAGTKLVSILKAHIPFSNSLYNMTDTRKFIG